MFEATGQIKREDESIEREIPRIPPPPPPPPSKERTRLFHRAKEIAPSIDSTPLPCLRVSNNARSRNTKRKKERKENEKTLLARKIPRNDRESFVNENKIAEGGMGDR